MPKRLCPDDVKTNTEGIPREKKTQDEPPGQKRFEPELEKTRKDLLRARAISHVGSWQYHIASGKAEWSDELYRIFGLKPQSFVMTYDRIMSMIHPDDQDKQEHYSDLLFNATPSTVLQPLDYRLIRPSGEVRHVHAEVEIQFDEFGKAELLIGTEQDVTKITVALNQLHASEQRHRGVVEDQTELIVQWRPDGVRTYVNEAYCRYFSRTREELIGTSFFPFVDETELTREHERLAQLTPENPITINRCQARLPGDQTSWMEWIDRAFFDDCGILTGYQSVGRDVTEQIRAQEALEQSDLKLRALNQSLETRVNERTRALKSANEEMEAFTYSVSHDLRAPLRAMEGFATALADDYGDCLDENAHEYIQNIRDSAMLMDLLVCDLLAYSRLGREKMPIEPVDLNSVVDVALSQLRNDIEATSAKIEVTGNLGSVLGHKRTLVQAVVNLISNGIKFVDSSVTPELAFHSEVHNDGKRRLWVRDNGIGINVENQSRVFGVFQRLHGVESYPGTGMGLAIVARTCERLNGDYGFDSETGCGSRFWIELPGHNLDA